MKIINIDRQIYFQYAGFMNKMERELSPLIKEHTSDHLFLTLMVLCPDQILLTMLKAQLKIIN